jgi:hypothetical protein
VKALLVDLDDTLLDYSGGVDDSWCQACDTVATPAGLDPAALSQAIARSRRWFWDDPGRHQRERLDMMGAWTKIAEHALAGLGEPGGAAGGRPRRALCRLPLGADAAVSRRA